jgi:hypothetical protein
MKKELVKKDSQAIACTVLHWSSAVVTVDIQCSNTIQTHSTVTRVPRVILLFDSIE